MVRPDPATSSFPFFPEGRTPTPPFERAGPSTLEEQLSGLAYQVRFRIS
jgi:hypothetical protein